MSESEPDKIAESKNPTILVK